MRWNGRANWTLCWQPDMRSALIQFSASDSPAENAVTLSGMIEEAAASGARFVLTPEVSNCVSTSRSHQNTVLRLPEEDQTLPVLQALAKTHGLHLLIGSLALKTGDADGRFANRSILLSPEGQILGSYDKIHMFDVDIDVGETYRESAGYRPGANAVVAQTDFARIGMCVCYDMRFPLLAHALAQAGAQVLTYPAAFSPVTGAAHWESLLRARAIETGCWVLAPAQTGDHKISVGRPRQTYGHSLVVDPWGEVVLDAGTQSGVYTFDLNMEKVAEARKRVPALANTRDFGGPD